MRLIKMLSLAAMAAVAAMAFVGASSAMAEFPTQLCKTDPLTSGTLVCGSPVTDVHYEATNALLVTPNVEVECDALFSGTAGSLSGLLVLEDENKTHHWLPQHVTGDLEYTSCTFGCSAQQESADTLIKVLKTGHELATVTGEGEVLVNCLGALHCIYDGDGLEGHGLGGLATGKGKGHVTFNEDNVSRAPGGLLLMLCPAEAELTALFISLTNEYLGS